MTIRYRNIPYGLRLIQKTNEDIIKVKRTKK